VTTQPGGRRGREGSPWAFSWRDGHLCPFSPNCRIILDPRSPQLPDGVCYDTCRASCEQFALPFWANSPDKKTRLVRQEWSIGWPLLVGEVWHPLPSPDFGYALPFWAQKEDRRKRLTGRPDYDRLLRLPGPFVRQPWAMAGLVVVRETGDGRATLFGLVEPAAYRDRGWGRFVASWRLVRPVVVAEGREALSEAQRLYDWYARALEGKRLGGRPRGSTVMTREEFEASYRDAYARLRKHFRRPRQGQVAEELAISERALRGYLARWRLPWPPR